MKNMKINSKALGNNKAIMQIPLDQNDSETIVQDLKEYATILSGSLGFDTAEVINEMTVSDFDHMVLVFKKYFSDYIEFIETDHVIVSKEKRA